MKFEACKYCYEHDESNDFDNKQFREYAKLKDGKHPLPDWIIKTLKGEMSMNNYICHDGVITRRRVG